MCTCQRLVQTAVHVKRDASYTQLCICCCAFMRNRVVAMAAGARERLLQEKRRGPMRCNAMQLSRSQCLPAE
jgi:hypothetical protein